MDKLKIMESIAIQTRRCDRCRLCKGAKNAVPGEGSVDSKIVFIGEAPGATEDETGRPFVGRAGQLLDKLLDEIGLKRSDVWIGNVIKHRPPNNREPLPEEISACEPYLALQLKTISPVLVVTLGRFAMYYFYKDGKISRDHGNLIKTGGGLSVYPIYHPAAALRQERFREALEKDFKRIPQILKQVELEGFIKPPAYGASDLGSQLSLGI